MIDAIVGLDTFLGGAVATIADLLPTTAGTIRVAIQLRLDGDADDGKYWDTNAGGSWQAAPTTWPACTHRTNGFWDYLLPAAAIAAKLGAVLKVVAIGDNLPTPASSTTMGGAFDTARVVNATEDWDKLIADHIIAGSFGELAQKTTAITGAAVNSAAVSYTLTTGTQSSGTVGDVVAVDEVLHQHTDTAGALDLYYEFDIGGDGLPTGATITGRLNGNNDDLDGVYAYNWVGTSWDRVGDFDGQNGTVNSIRNYQLLTAHVGAAADLGKVRIRLWAAAGLSSATLSVDQILCSYAVASRTVGYANGAVWIDTNGSNTSTEAYVSGVADNPVSTIASARTIADAVGLKRFQFAAGSSATLAQSYAGYEFVGLNYTLALGGQPMSGALIQGADVTGNDSGTNANPIHLHMCTLNGNTLGLFHVLACELTSDLMLIEAGHYVMDQCYSGVAGVLTPSLDVGAALGDTDISIRHYSGGLEIKNLGGAGTDIVSMEGMGQLILNASCVGGTVAIRGTFELTDNSGGAVTISDDARVTIREIDTELTAQHGAGNWAVAALTGTSTVTITVTDSTSGAPLEGVEVNVYDATGAIFQGVVETNILGVAQFNRNDATYIIRLSKALFIPTNAEETLIVSGNTGVGYTGAIFAPGSVPAAGMCSVFGTIWDVAGLPHEGVEIEFSSVVDRVVSGVQYSSRTTSVTTDAAGFFQVDLVRGTLVHIESTEIGLDIDREVPNTTSQDFTTWARLYSGI